MALEYAQAHEVQAKQSMICTVILQGILLRSSCRLMSTIRLNFVGIVILKCRPVRYSGINFGKINGLFQLTIHIRVSLGKPDVSDRVHKSAGYHDAGLRTPVSANTRTRISTFHSARHLQESFFRCKFWASVSV